MLLAILMYWEHLLPPQKVSALNHASGFSSVQKFELSLRKVASVFMILLLLL